MTEEKKSTKPEKTSKNVPGGESVDQSAKSADKSTDKSDKSATSSTTTPAPGTSQSTTPPANQPNPKLKMPDQVKQFGNKSFIYLIIGLLFLPFIFSFFGSGKREQISISQLMRDVKEDKVAKLEVAGTELRANYKDDSRKATLKEDGQTALNVLQSSGIDFTALDVEVQNISYTQLFWEMIVNFLPLGVVLIVLFMIMRQAKGSQDGILGIGRSKAKLFIKGKQNTKFADVGGMTEAKQELEEIVDFLKHPKKYTKVGARTPKGVLLVGPAGTGKTLLARAVAGEAGVQFLSIAGSEFMEMLVGVGASRVRDLFSTAKKLAPSIIFIDEIDAIGRIRGQGSFGGHDEREQTLNQILVEMDGFTQNDNVIVMAATNRGDMLDPALVRPGRFDRRVMVNLPDLEERKHILKIHAKSKPMDEDLTWDKVAKRTIGFSGADIENMLNEAAITIARESRLKITMQDIDEAAMKVKLGPSKKRLTDDYERQMTAYHEAGHAVIAHVKPFADPVHRISIVSRGMALGYTLTPPEKDKLQVTKSELMNDLVVMLGGRAAEMQIFNEQTAGASNDIERATQMARSMVMVYGMSSLGPMNFTPQYDTSYMRAWGEPSKISDSLQEKVDQEIRDLITAAEVEAAELLEKYKVQLVDVSKKLLELETLDGDEFSALMKLPKAKPPVLE